MKFKEFLLKYSNISRKNDNFVIFFGITCGTQTKEIFQSQGHFSIYALFNEIIDILRI